MTVAEALDQIQIIQAAIPGVRKAYNGNEPPDAIEMPPAFMTFISNGRPVLHDHPPSMEIVTVPFVMRLYLEAKDLRLANKLAIPFLDVVRATFRTADHIRLNGTVQTAFITQSTYGVMEYSSIRFFGWEFVLTARMRTAL